MAPHFKIRLIARSDGSNLFYFAQSPAPKAPMLSGWSNRSCRKRPSRKLLPIARAASSRAEKVTHRPER